MKKLFGGIVCIGLLIAVYVTHQRQVANPAPDTKSEVPGSAGAVKTRGVLISRLLEPTYQKLYSNLDIEQAEDLVPPLELSRARILDRKARVEPEKKAIYDLGSALVSALIPVAEERTSALESLIQASRSTAALDSKKTLSNTNQFFGQTAAKKWEDQKRRSKPATDQAFARLREAERVFNQNAGAPVQTDGYDLPALQPVMITSGEPSGPQGSLDKAAYNQRKESWRRSFYKQYGNPRTN